MRLGLTYFSVLAALWLALFAGQASAGVIRNGTAANPFSTEAPSTLQLFPELGLPGQELLLENRDISLHTAIAATERGDLGNAYKMFQALHSAYPAAVAPYIGMAEVKARLGKFEAADALLSSGIAATHDAPALYRARARLYASKGLKTETIKAFRKAIDLSPRDRSLQLEFADYLVQRANDPQQALTLYRAVIKADPGNGAAHYGLAFALSRTGKLDEAIAELEEAQALSKNNPLPALAKARLYLQQNKNAQAQSAFDRAVAMKPDFAEAHFERANFLMRKGRYSEALKDFEATLKLSPKSAGALLGIGMAHQALGQNAQAIKAYRKFLEIAPDSALALNNLAWLSSGNKADLDAALEWAKRATSLAPKQAEYYDTLGWVYYQRGELREAEEQFQHAIALSPSAVGYTHLGMVYGEIGQKGLAADNYRQALKLDGNFKPAQQALRKLQ